MENISPKNIQESPRLHVAYAGSKSEHILQEFETSLQGLTEKEAEKRLREYGYNEPAKKKKISVLAQFLSKFLSPLSLALLVIVAVSLFFGEKISALFIFVMVLISVILDFVQEYRSGKEVEKLNELIHTNAAVIRDNIEREMNIKHIVPGDIVVLNAGDMVPADLRLISCKDLFINQASLTGESFPVEKGFLPVTASSTSELKNIAFMGSSVVTGTGIGVVVRTGTSTAFGEISKSLTAPAVETSFDRGVRQFTLLMIRLIIILVIVIFLTIFVFKHGLFKDALLFSLAVAVGLTPEMLPMLVTLNLSKGAISMAKKKVIVKRLSSIQNLGAMDVLCTDKTGTITLDKIILEKHCDVEGKEDEDVLRFAYINSSYQTGLTNLLDRTILSHEKLLIKHYKKIDEIPYDFSRKLMSVVVALNHKHSIISKGAPEEVFKRCTHYELKGKVYSINRKILSKLEKEYDKLSEAGFRVLAVAYRDVKDKKNRYFKDDEKNLVLKGYLAFLDPAKPSTKKVLNALEALGIEVKILTGDNELVTKKICNDVGLSIKGLVTGIEIHGMTDEKLQSVVENTTIFARLSPAQKERVIKALHRNKHIVGYLGDGINDAPALKISDVGISVNNAVDIAKESADIILLEKSLMVLEEGVEEGRKVFGNITKYVKMSASSNFGNMLSMTGAALFLPFLPMLPVQILLNNFLYDMSQVSLPTDAVDREYLAKPRPWNNDIIKMFILFIGPISSIFDYMTFGVMLFIFHAGPSLFHTGWFLESLCTQTLVIYIIRTNKLPFIESRPSKFLVITTVSILLFGFLLPFSPLGTHFGFTPLPALYFAILSGMVIMYLILVQIVKSWVVKKYGYA
jgi:Mg2+-importing ATPase